MWIKHPPLTIIFLGVQRGGCLKLIPRYIIRKGICSLFKNDEDVDTVLMLKSGDIFSEISLIRPKERQLCSVVALEWSELALIKHKDFLDVIAYYPKEKERFDKEAKARYRDYRRIRNDSYEGRLDEIGWKNYLERKSGNYALDSASFTAKNDLLDYPSSNSESSSLSSTPERNSNSFSPKAKKKSPFGTN